MESSNKERAQRFEVVLRTYGTDDTDRGCLTDLLADARHWCDRAGQSFWDCDHLAHQHYLAELQEERSEA
jgi:hypothetical protein